MTVRYVGPGGNNSNDGLSWANRKLTLNGVEDTPVAAGDIVYVGAGVAGIAGALLAQTTQFVGLDSLSFHRSAELMIMLVLGGTGRLYGGLVGAAIFMVAQNYLADLNPIYWQFWLGLLLVLVVMFARGGVLGGLAAVRARLKGAAK